MRRFQVPGSRPDTAQGFSTHEKRRLLALTAGSLIVAFAILYGFYRSQQGASSPAETRTDELEFDATVATPEVDAAALEALVADGTPEQRVVLEGDAVAELLDVTRNLTTRHYRAMGVQELTPETAAQLLGAPAGRRGEAFRVRGWVDDVRTRTRSGAEQHILRLRLEGAPEDRPAFAYLLTPKVSIALLDDVFVTAEGLFLKGFADEDADRRGTWLTGPLLVGGAPQHSSPDLGTVASLDAGVFEDVEDDRLDSPLGLVPDPERSIPFTPLWTLMAYARDLPPDAVDWSGATLLDDVALRALGDDGERHRLQPYRIPLSRLQDARVKAAGENPARIERYTEGWIGNAQWSNVIRFMGPFEDHEAELADYVEARGFFLKHFSYVSADRGIRVAPFFVLHSMELVEPKPAPIFGKIVTSIFIATLVAIAGFVFLVVRDGRRSRQLQEDIVRRRQARRRNRALQGQGT